MEKNRIAIEKIESDDVKAAVFTSLAHIGASALLKREGMKILLKPNLLIAKSPEQAATTHPAVLDAVIQWLLQFNPAKIWVSDSAGGLARGTTLKAAKSSGIFEICEKYDSVEFVPFESTPRKVYPVPDPLVLESISSSELLEEADLIINLPKIKTHGLCHLTCTLKNMFGTIILGNKSQIHSRYPAIDDFNAALVDIYSVSTPQLTVIDGYWCQEGSGPSRGDPVKMDLILAGYDPVALDATVCKLIGFDAEDVTAIGFGAEKKLGTDNLESIQYFGTPLTDVQRDFKPARVKAMNIRLPPKLMKKVSKTLFRSKIEFDAEKCRLCKTCWENCPVDAIDPPKEMKKGQIPRWIKNKCIACYCCAELCPHDAVDFKINIAKNVLTSWIGINALLLLGGIIAVLYFLLR